MSIAWSGTQGDIKLTYTTQMKTSENAKGHTKYQGVINGKFEFTDKATATVTDASHLRVCLEFGTKDKAKTYRE